MINRINKAKLILHEEGSLALFKALLLFFRNLLLTYASHNIYESTLDAPIIPPKVSNLTLRVITSPEEVDHLSGEGFEPSRLSLYKKQINEGGILFCAFAGEELAHVCMVCIGRRIDEVYPYSFARQYGHTIGLGAFTAPTYRRKGIHVYTRSKVFQYLREKGISRAWDVQYKDNIAARNAILKLGYYLWGEGHYLRVLSLVKFEWINPKSRVARFRMRCSWF